MKLVFFIGYYPEIVGGAQKQARLIYDELSKNNEIIYISYPYTNKNVINEKTIYRLKLYNKIHKYTFYYIFMYKVYKILKKEKPEIVYQRVLNSFTFHLSRYCKKLNIPLILHIADNYSLNFDKLNISTLVRKYFFKKIIKNRTYFICQTYYQKEMLEKLGVIPLDVIPNIFKKININIKPKDKRQYITWIGNVRPVKNIELFLELSKNINTNYKFCILGEISNDKYGLNILEMIKSSNVVYHGLVNEEVINKILSESLVLVNTSYSEGLSNTFIEAWMLGTPVISFNSNPNNYFYRYQLGFFCNGDKSLLLNYVNKILYLDSSEFEKLSFNCYDFSFKEFDSDLITKRIINILKMIKQ